jgi:RNA polymerase sigma-70 factor (ECF subfamily)
MSFVSETCDQLSDERLLIEAGSRESKDALAVLFRRHRKVVLNVARRILRDDCEAEDLCQEVFLSLFQSARLFDATKGRALSWIIQITYSRALSRRKYLAHRRHYDAEELNEEQIEAGGNQELIDDIAAKTLLSRFQGHLTKEQRYTIELHFFEGYSLREIAEKTDETLGNTRHHFYRGLKRLRSGALHKRIT